MLMMPNWLDLPEDVVVSIANRIALIEDYITFGLVCKPWRSAATKQNFTSRLTYQVPFLMLQPYRRAGQSKSIVRELSDLAKDKAIKLPEAKTIGLGNVPFYSSLGWLLIVRSPNYGGCNNPNVYLYHRTSNTRKDLPMFRDSEWESLRRSLYFDWFALSSSPSWTSDYVVMVIYRQQRLAFCRPGQGHEYWTSIVFESQIKDVTYYKGQIYAVGSTGTVFVCDIERARARVVVPEIPWQLGDYYQDRFSKTCYMVESSGELLLVFLYHKGTTRVAGIKIFKVPFSDGIWGLDSGVTDLGSKTLFLDEYSSSFSVEASGAPGCQPNCVYFFRCSGWSPGAMCSTGGDIKLYILDKEDREREDDEQLFQPHTTFTYGEYDGYWRPSLWMQRSF